jgi:hypothetical protein
MGICDEGTVFCEGKMRQPINEKWEEYKALLKGEGWDDWVIAEIRLGFLAGFLTGAGVMGRSLGELKEMQAEMREYLVEMRKEVRKEVGDASG